jgi:hypothetical protein
MAWVYDVNFPRTFQVIRERNYLEAIHNTLPQTEMMADIYAQLGAYVEERCEKNEGENRGKRKKGRGDRS